MCADLKKAGQLQDTSVFRVLPLPKRLIAIKRSGILSEFPGKMNLADVIELTSLIQSWSSLWK